MITNLSGRDARGKPQLAASVCLIWSRSCRRTRRTCHNKQSPDLRLVPGPQINTVKFRNPTRSGGQIADDVSVIYELKNVYIRFVFRFQSQRSRNLNEFVLKSFSAINFLIFFHPNTRPPEITPKKLPFWHLFDNTSDFSFKQKIIDGTGKQYRQVTTEKFRNG